MLLVTVAPVTMTVPILPFNCLENAEKDTGKYYEKFKDNAPKKYFPLFGVKKENNMPKLGFPVPCICESCIEIKIKLILKRPKYAVYKTVQIFFFFERG